MKRSLQELRTMTYKIERDYRQRQKTWTFLEN